MQGHRNKATRRNTPTALTLAGEIWESLDTKPIWKTPADFLAEDEPTEPFEIEPGKTKIKGQSLFGGAGVQIGDTFHETGDEERATYLAAHARAQIWGEIEVPTNSQAAQNALLKWGETTENTQAIFEAEARARTIDEKLAARIVSELWKKCRAH